jgi:hypothetical protein
MSVFGMRQIYTSRLRHPRGQSELVQIWQRHVHQYDPISGFLSTNLSPEVPPQPSRVAVTQELMEPFEINHFPKWKKYTNRAERPECP